ncbi:hypothetical protein ACQ4PT_010384 [Festuca glaucescens]
METRRQEQQREERQQLADSLDPAVKAGIEVSLEAATDAMTKSIADAVKASLSATIATAVRESLVGTQRQIEDLVHWRTDLDARFSNLQATVSQMQRGPSSSAASGPMAAHLAVSPFTTNRVDTSSAAGKAHGPDGHGVVYTHRVVPNGEPPSTHPVTGTEFLSGTQVAPNSSARVFQSLGHQPPALSFPVFTGENPKLWRTLSEQYFTMYTIHESYWVSMAILNFSGSASIWLQSVRERISGFSWDSLCELLCTRFGRDKHQVLIRQFYYIRQITSVAEYIERFEILVNHLASYSDQIHPLYVLTKFVEGLRKDIRAAVMVQRPVDLDTACSLACLQEEILDGVPYADTGQQMMLPVPAQHCCLRHPLQEQVIQLL